MNAQFDEEVVHLPNISCISMRVQDGSRGHGVPNIDGGDLIAASRRQPQDVDVLAVGERVHEKKPSGVVRN